MSKAGIYALLVLFFLSPHVGACSLATADLFKPTLERFEALPGPAQKEPPESGPYWEPIPKPEVKVLKLTRGTAAPGASCADAGTVSISVALPRSSKYDIDQFGIYFRVIGGEQPDQIFSGYPLVGPTSGRKMAIFLAWLDGAPETQSPISLQVEAFFVADDLSIGPSAIFEITSK